jgi:hypothetical protein
MRISRSARNWLQKTIRIEVLRKVKRYHNYLRRIECGLIGFLLPGLLCSQVVAGTLFAIKQTDVDFLLVEIDTMTFQITEVGPLQTQFRAGGLGWDPQNERLYMVSAVDNYLWTIDPDSGRADIVAEHHPQYYNISFESLTYNCSDDLLYSTTYRGRFYSINPNDATAELISTSTSGEDVANDHFSALTYNFRQDALLGIRTDGATLFRLDWLKRKGKTLLADLEDGFDRFGLAYDPDLNRYWAVNEAGELLSFDPSSFEHTVHRTGLGRLDGLAYRHTLACEKRPFMINFGLTDAWFDATNPGQGFFVNLLLEVGVFFVGWFTFDLERPLNSSTAILGENGHRWLTAQGNYHENKAVLKIYLTEGGVFDSKEPLTETNEIGEMIMTFQDCKRVSLGYSIPYLAIQDHVDLVRVSDDRVPFCIEQEFLAQPD